MPTTETAAAFAVIASPAKQGEAISYYHTDHLGSSSIVTNSSGEVIRRTEYKPFGEIFLNLETNPGSDIPNFFYTGKRLDKDTGLYYYGARYYDPTIGRFTQPDTIIPNPSNPQDFNRYSYCNNNPINYTDPTGHFKWKEWKGKIIGAIVGAITLAATGGNWALAWAAYGFVSGTIDSYSAGYSVGQSIGMGIAVGTASYLGGQIGGAFGSWVGGASESAAALGSAIFGGAAAGAAGGATGAALTGGNVGKAAAQGAAIGGITGLFMHGLTYRGPPAAEAAEADAAAQEALTVDLNDDPPVDVYHRGLDWKNDGQPVGPRLHPFMRDWEGQYYELEKAGNNVTIFKGSLTNMSKATQTYMNSNPKPDRTVWVSKSRFHSAINAYENTNRGKRYTSYRQCEHFVGYVINHSEYGLKKE